MAMPFNELRKKLSPECRERNEARARTFMSSEYEYKRIPAR
jgi:hypothetical protein